MFNGVVNVKNCQNKSWRDMDGSNVLVQHILGLNNTSAKVLARKSALKKQLWALSP